MRTDWEGRLNSKEDFRELLLEIIRPLLPYYTKEKAGIVLGVTATTYTQSTTLYVHSDYQGKGIATAICNQLESAVQENIVTHASVTARPFFEKRGYKVIKEQQVERQKIFLTNFVMIKER